MRLLVLDGNSILNRAFYGIKILTNSEGQFTNAIYGFMTTFKKIEDEFNPEFIAVAFDVKAPTFRHKLYDNYKANRKGMPEELAQQLPVLKELLNYLGYKIITCPGYEADDIIGTLASRCEEKGYDCIIATGDRDSLQLVSKNVSVRLVSTKLGKSETVLYDENKVYETYGVSPEKLIEIKALQGDASDNIPGVRGIGEKSAKTLIQKFNSIDTIYSSIDTIDIKQNLKNKLIEGKESAYLSRVLGTIVKNVPIEDEIDSFVRSKIDVENAKRLLTKLEFFSIIQKLNLDDLEKNITSKIVKNGEVKLCIGPNLDELKNEVKEFGEICLYTDYNKKDLERICIYFNKKVVMIDNSQNGFYDFIRDVFQDKNIKKIVYHMKNLMLLLFDKNIKIYGENKDVMLCSYIINPSLSDYSLESLCERYSVTLPEYDKANLDIHQQKMIECVLAIGQIIKVELSILQKNSQLDLLNNMEQPLSEVLASMESYGFRIDVAGLSNYGDYLERKIEELTSKIYTLCGGTEFNINSPKQLGDILFKKLCLPTGKKGKNGYSTNAEILEGLRNYHPVVGDILDYRVVTKLKSTYCDGMLKVVSGDGRIHSNFNQTETRTGRISSTEPNLQNIPIRSEIGKELRKYFLAEDGYILVDADYSQIELRVLAHISNDRNMIDAFNNDQDIHAITASQIFGVPVQMITSAMRSRAKAVNFGIVYGIGAFSLSKDLGISRYDADRYIKNYLKHYSGVDKYMKEIVDFAKEKGYVETLFNRRRYLPEISASNFNLRSFGERVARNMPIQGTAADIIKMAMIKVYNRLNDMKLKSRLILQVHDELIVETCIEEVEMVEKILTEEMQNAVKLSVPMVVHLSKGKTWYDAKD